MFLIFCKLFLMRLPGGCTLRISELKVGRDGSYSILDHLVIKEVTGEEDFLTSNHSFYLLWLCDLGQDKSLRRLLVTKIQKVRKQRRQKISTRSRRVRRIECYKVLIHQNFSVNHKNLISRNTRVDSKFREMSYLFISL